MQPDFIIDKCESIKDRVISLRLTDESGTIDDVVEVCVDYRDENLNIPNELNISLRYREIGVMPMGVYTINEITVQSPPKTLLIKAHATNLRLSLKEKVSKEWHQITLGDLVKEIAEKHGYRCRVAEEFENVLIPHINQIEESDISLLTKIAIEYGAMAKLAGGYILFIPKGKAKSATGKALGTTAIRPQDTINWKVHFTVSRYNSVVAKWHSYEKGETISETSGSGTPSYTIQALYSNAESALSAATAKLKQLKRNNAVLDITIPGNPELFAEAKLNLVGFNQDIDGEWVIDRAEHILSSSRYCTSLSASTLRENKSNNYLMSRKVLNMSKDPRNKLHSWWFIVTVVCIIITCCYMKAKATDNYKTILRVASKNCSLEVVKSSANNLLDINTQIPELTALHYASGAGCLEVVKFLIEKGADINTAKYERWTALHSAAYRGNLETIRFLLDKGADPTIRDTDGKTPRKKESCCIKIAA